MQVLSSISPSQSALCSRTNGRIAAPQALNSPRFEGRLRENLLPDGMPKRYLIMPGALVIGIIAGLVGLGALGHKLFSNAQAPETVQKAPENPAPRQ
jgi:hypothetical protein